MNNIKQLEENVAKSFFNVKQDISKMKKQIELSKKEKSEIVKAIKMQNETIKQIYENQKHLLLRIKEIEKALKFEKKNEKIIIA